MAILSIANQSKSIPNRGESLLDRRSELRAPGLLALGCDDHQLNPLDRHASLPSNRRSRRQRERSRVCIRVADVRGEELDESAASAFTRSCTMVGTR